MIKGIQDRRLVLHVKDAALSMDLAGTRETIDIDLDLHGGEMVMIHLQHPQQGSALADVCAGLLRPQRGTVQFLGKAWSELPPDTENALRGRIGRVFAEGNWLSHLTMLENILLPQIHHTRRPTQELCEEAGRLAVGFGLPGVPAGFPGMFHRTDLRIAACIRAFLGHLSLIMLENPTVEGYPEMVPHLVNAIRNARGTGAAVVWMVTQEKIWRDRSIPATGRYRLAGGKLMEVTG